MNKLELLQKTNQNINVNKMNLNEIKTIIYLNKKNNKLSDNIIKILNNKISNIIYLSNNKNNTNIDTHIDTDINTETDTNLDTDTESSSELVSETDSYFESINKMYSKNNKKNQNNQTIHTSKKLYDRMLSQAEIINNSYKNIVCNKIEKPFIDINNFNQKLGIRKNIKL
jgi:hypothetical protein